MPEAAHSTAEREHNNQAKAQTPTTEPEASVVDERVLGAAASGVGMPGAPAIPNDAKAAAARHADILSDPRIQRTSVTQRARMVQQIQRGYGNQHVARVMAQRQHASEQQVSNNHAAPPVQREAACAAPPVDRPPPTPERDPAFQQVRNKAVSVAAKEKKHAPARAKAQEAQGAAVGPANEVASQAAAKQVGTMSQQKPGAFDKKAFVASLKQAIEAITPKNQEEADDFKKSGKAAQLKQQVSGPVKQGKDSSEKDIKETTKAAPDASGAHPKPVTPMKPEQPGAATTSVGAAGGMPAPAKPNEVSLAYTKCETDGEMADAGVTEEQLKKSNEPEFNKALGAKKQAETQAVTGPAQVRAQERTVLGEARAEANATSSAALGGMHTVRAGVLGHVAGSKNATKGKDEAERAKIAAKLEEIYGKAKQEVSVILDGLEGKVNAAFDAGEQAARAAFENFVAQKMDAYKERRYSGIAGKLRWVKDKFTDMPAEVNTFYEAGRKLYLRQMDGVIDRVADVVGGELTRAKARIAQGRAEIQKYVADLPKELRQVGQEAAQEIGGKFEQLDQEVDSKKDALVQSLAQRYVAARNSVDERINQMKEANKGLLAKAKDAIGGVIQTILQLKDMLLGVLARAAGVIDKIIKDPIGFLGNLLNGIKQGLHQFVANIGTHLKKGLMGWLFGEIAATGIELPKSFDIQGILTLVMQLLGLTWQAIRAQAVKILGEPAVKILEGAFELFKIIKDKGLGALWEYIKDQLGNLKAMVLDGIKDMVITQVIQAGIQWLLGVLGGPAGAFIKACKAIIDVVMWFVNNGSRVAALVNSVLNSVSAIANGSIGQAANFIEQSLGNAVPMMIGFLASLLGLGNLGQKIKGIIEKVQAPVQKAVGWVLGKAKGFASKIMGKVKGAFGKKDEKPEDKEKRLKKGLDAGVAAVDKFAGKRVGKLVLNPVLGVIKLRYRLSILQPVEREGYWAVQGDIQRMDEKKSRALPDSSQSVSDDPVFQTAKSGGKHAGFYNTYKDKDEAQVRKGIDSINKQIADHEDKIANPKNHILNFGNLDPRQQKALIEKKWPSDIARQKEQRAILEGILLERRQT